MKQVMRVQEIVGWEKMFPTLFDAMVAALPTNALRVKFRKVDGSLREMYCTLMPEEFADFDFAGGEPRDTEDLAVVWDIEKADWRSIKRGTVESMERVVFDYV